MTVLKIHIVMNVQSEMGMKRKEKGGQHQICTTFISIQDAGVVRFINHQQEVDMKNVSCVEKVQNLLERISFQQDVECMRI